MKDYFFLVIASIMSAVMCGCAEPVKVLRNHEAPTSTTGMEGVSNFPIEHHMQEFVENDIDPLPSPLRFLIKLPLFPLTIASAAADIVYYPIYFYRVRNYYKLYNGNWALRSDSAYLKIDDSLTLIYIDGEDSGNYSGPIAFPPGTYQLTFRYKETMSGIKCVNTLTGINSKKTTYIALAGARDKAGASIDSAAFKNLFNETCPTPEGPVSGNWNIAITPIETQHATKNSHGMF